MKHTAHALLSLLALLLLTLSACDSGGAGGTSNNPTGSNSSIPYESKAGSVLIQLFPEPGFVYPQINAIPTWTLYGDGTLVMRSSPGNQLQQARLSSGEVQQILDMVVRQQAFFSSTRSSYGEVAPDVGATELTINAQNQQKTVRLLREPSAGKPVDSETQHVFAIKNYLLRYQPQQVQPYVPAGIALIVLPSKLQNLPLQWPYNDISLAKVAAQECGYVPQQDPCTQQTSGIFPVYGTRGLDILKRWSTGRASVQQNNVNYMIIVWPLLPDALVTQPDGSQGVLTTGTHPGRKLLLPGPGSGTPTAH
ncbi:MAG TPA: hypothetical protein VFB12_27600 [Ktedonobacteraceae bacterium]|nr:hypothetical protein [Ktedonobacteraceae bacterium]